MADGKMSTELSIKLSRIRNWMMEKRVDGLLLSSLASFSWLSGGRGHISLASEQACGKLLITLSNAYLIINNIEAERISKEEASLPVFETVVFPWHTPEFEKEICRRILGETQWVEEQEVSGEISRLRWQLTDEEIQRYRSVGKAVAKALEKTCFEIRQGETELQIAARLAANCLQKGIDPVLQLVAADDRANL